MREPVMQGRGFYNEHSEVQARAAEEADGVLERALSAVTISTGPSPLLISAPHRATIRCARCPSPWTG
jgi:hypothetical protein